MDITLELKHESLTLVEGVTSLCTVQGVDVFHRETQELLNVNLAAQPVACILLQAICGRRPLPHIAASPRKTLENAAHGSRSQAPPLSRRREKQHGVWSPSKQ